jgi:hypothetical protein
MKNNSKEKKSAPKGFSNSKPPARDKLDSRGDLEINEKPSGNNKKPVKIGFKTEHNDPQGSTPGK